MQRIDDPHHPRGYRELRSKAEMRKLLDRKIVEQNRRCAICEVAFTNYSDLVPDHIDPRGMGGSRRDDHPDNYPGSALLVQRREGIHEGVLEIVVGLSCAI